MKLLLCGLWNCLALELNRDHQLLKTRQLRLEYQARLHFRVGQTQQRLQVLQVEQQQTLAVRHLERGIEGGLLAVGQFQQGAEQQGAHLAQGGAQRVAAVALHIPQRKRIGPGLMAEPGHAGDALGDLALRLAGGAEAAQVALDVGGEHRHAGIAEGFGHTLQCDGLAGTGSACDQSVAIRQAHGLGDRLPREIGADNKLQ